MIDDKMREVFERRFPVPNGIYWDAGAEQYEVDEALFTRELDSLADIQQARLQGYIAAPAKQPESEPLKWYAMMSGSGPHGYELTLRFETLADMQDARSIIAQLQPDTLAPENIWKFYAAQLENVISWMRENPCGKPRMPERPAVSASSLPGQTESEPVYVCHKCEQPVHPPAPFKAHVWCTNCHVNTAATIAANLGRPQPSPQVPEDLLPRVKNLLLSLGHQGEQLNPDEPPYDVGEWGVREAQELYTQLSAAPSIAEKRGGEQ